MLSVELIDLLHDHCVTEARRHLFEVCPRPNKCFEECQKRQECISVSVIQAYLKEVAREN